MEVTLVERTVYILDMNVERRSGSTLRLCDYIVLGVVQLCFPPIGLVA